VSFAVPPPKLEYLSMPWPEEEEEFATILAALTAYSTACFQQLLFSHFEGELSDLSPFFDGYNGHVCAVHYQEKEKMWYSIKGGSLMGSLTLAVKFGSPYEKSKDNKEITTEELEEGIMAYMKFPKRFFDEISSALSTEERMVLAKELGVWNRCLFIELST